MGSKMDSLAGRGHFLQKNDLEVTNLEKKEKLARPNVKFRSRQIILCTKIRFICKFSNKIQFKNLFNILKLAVFNSMKYSFNKKIMGIPKRMIQKNCDKDV